MTLILLAGATTSMLFPNVDDCALARRDASRACLDHAHRLSLFAQGRTSAWG